MAQHCVTCGSPHGIKNGSVKGMPKKKCQTCGYQFTKNTLHIPKSKPVRIKVFAVWLYLSGVSMHRMSQLLHVSTQSILNGIRQYARAHYEKPHPTGNAGIIAVDAMWHYLKKNANNSGSGQRWIAIQDSSLTGNVGIVIRPPSRNGIKDSHDGRWPYSVQMSMQSIPQVFPQSNGP